MYFFFLKDGKTHMNYEREKEIKREFVFVAKHKKSMWLHLKCKFVLVRPITFETQAVQSHVNKKIISFLLVIVITKLQTQSFSSTNNSPRNKSIVFTVIKIPCHLPHPPYMNIYIHIHKLKSYKLFNINEIYLLKYMQYIIILISHFIS